MFSSDDGLCGIGELAERARVSVKTVRFYSDNGLLPEASRSAGGHRRYGPDSLERLRMIRSLRTLDLPVPTVRRILDEGDTPGRAGGALEDAVAGQLRVLGSQLTAMRWREAALRSVQECPTAERPGRLALIGALTTPPDTAPLARFWRAWLPARMPARAVTAFLEAAVPQPPEDPEPVQVIAFAGLCALVSRPCEGNEVTQPHAHEAAGARESAVLYAGLAEAYDLAGAEMRRGREPYAGTRSTDSSTPTRASTGPRTPVRSGRGSPSDWPPIRASTATGSSRRSWSAARRGGPSRHPDRRTTGFSPRLTPSWRRSRPSGTPVTGTPARPRAARDRYHVPSAGPRRTVTAVGRAPTPTHRPDGRATGAAAATPRLRTSAWRP